MKQKFILRLTDKERTLCNATIDKLEGISQKAPRGRILRLVDADRPNWTDRLVAAAFRCRTRTVENVPTRYVLEGHQAGDRAGAEAAQ